MWSLQQKYLFRYQPLWYILVLVLCLVVPVVLSCCWWMGLINHGQWGISSIVSVVIGLLIHKGGHPFDSWYLLKSMQYIKLDLSDLTDSEVLMLMKEAGSISSDDNQPFAKIHDSKLYFEIHGYPQFSHNTVLFGSIMREYYEHHPYCFTKSYKMDSRLLFYVLIFAEWGLSLVFNCINVLPLPVVLCALIHISRSPLSTARYMISSILRPYNSKIQTGRVMAGSTETDEYKEVKQFMEDMK